MSKFPSDLFPITTPDGAEEWQFLGVVPHALNEALVYVSKELIHDDVNGFDSATNPRNWSILATDPRTPSATDPSKFFIPDGVSVPTYQPEVGQVVVDEADSRQLRVRFNTPLESRVGYELTASASIRAPGCAELIGVGTRSFQGLYRGIASEPRFVQMDVYRDFDLQFFPQDPRQPESTWRFDTTSDIGIQNAADSLRKRLYRRVMTSPGGFRHLGRGYGMTTELKQLVRSGELQRLANRAAEQARDEPDVISASAETRLKFGPGGAGIVELTIRVIRNDRQEFRFTFDEAVSGSIAA